MSSEDTEHLTLYLLSFVLGQKAHWFRFPVLELRALGVGISCGRGLMTISMAAWTEAFILILGGTALVLIAGFTSSVPSVLRKFSLVIDVVGYFFLKSTYAFKSETLIICVKRTNGHFFEILWQENSFRVLSALSTALLRCYNRELCLVSHDLKCLLILRNVD